MSRRRAACGQPTTDGTPCRNGPGCTTNHHTTLSGQPASAAVAVGGAGPDPLAVGGAAVAPAAETLGDVLGQLAAEAKNAGVSDPHVASAVGVLFEPVALEWLRKAPPQTPLGVFAADEPGGTPPLRSDIKEVEPFKEYTEGRENEIGIDAVATMTDETLVAIQIKTGDEKLTLKSLDGFLGQMAVDCGPRTYKYAVLIYTNKNGIASDAAKTFTRHSKLLLIDRGRLKGALPEGGWQQLLDDTKEDRSRLLENRQSRQSRQKTGSVETGATTNDDAGGEAGADDEWVSWEESKAAAFRRQSSRQSARNADRAAGAGAAKGESDLEKSQRQHAALPGQLDALGLDPGVLSEELTLNVVEPAAAYEGDLDVAVSDLGAQLGLAARQTVLYEYHSAAAEAVNRRRKVTMSVLRDDHKIVSSALARLITVFTPPAKMAEVRAKAADKAADKGKDFDPDSVYVVSPTRAQQIAIEGAEIRGTKKEEKKKSGRPKQPKERRLATAYQQLVALKATDPDLYDQYIAALGEATGPEEEASP